MTNEETCTLCESKVAELEQELYSSKLESKELRELVHVVLQHLEQGCDLAGAKDFVRLRIADIDKRKK